MNPIIFDQFKHPKFNGTYYHASSNSSPIFPKLIGEEKTDICIIGGGLTGISSALNLAETGQAVTLVEGMRIGSGASGRNGGQIVQGYSCDIETMIKTVGQEKSALFWSMAREAIEEIDRRINLHKISCARQSGYVFAATNNSQFKLLKRINQKLKNTFNYEATSVLDQNTIKKWVKTESYVGGLLDYGSGQFHSLKYLHGLTEAAKNIGVQFFEDSKAIQISGGDTITVKTAHGSVKAKTLIIAGNAYLRGLEDTLQRKIIRVTSTVGVTTPLSPTQINSVLPGGVPVADCNNILDYFKITDDKRLLFGAGADYLGRETKNKKSLIRNRIINLFPQLNEFDLEYVWNGFIAATKNQLPEIICAQPNIYIAQGFSGHGLALTGLAGILITEKINGVSERFDIFASINHQDMPLHPYRNPLLIAAMLINKLKDFYH